MENISIESYSDEKGYLDRECPECLYVFKINMDDWNNKISDDKVHCPMCGYVDTSDMWYTPEQLETIQEITERWVMNYASREIDKALADLARSTQNNKYIKIAYDSEKRTTFINNPIGQREEWILDITCEDCGTRFSVIGTAYFCPCCGYSSITRVFDDSMETVSSMINEVPLLKQTLTENLGMDKAEMMCRSMVESALCDVVSAFQKFACSLFVSITGKEVRPNDFQVVDKGSRLFLENTGKGYSEWCTDNEMKTLKLMFQRRHLIEHNDGLVDQKYIDKSNDNAYQVGQRIVIKEDDVFLFVDFIKKLCDGLKTLK